MNKLKLLREERALTQSEVAESVSITTSYYGMIESGRRVPSLPIAMRLAKHFNLSVEKIFTHSNND